jgi:Holliday junction resolvasome RuvABC endonuclease subunit
VTFRPLTFDLATNTGWAFHDGARPVCGLWDLSSPFGKARADKIDSFSRRLTLAVKELQPTMIAAESPLMPMHGSGVRVDMNALLTSWGLFTYLELACRRLKLPLRSVNTTAIKQIATGHGARWKDPVTREWRKPDKAMVLAAMKIRYPELEIASHDVADALGIMTLLLAEQRGTGAPRPTLVIPKRARKVRGRRPAAGTG